MSEIFKIATILYDIGTSWNILIKLQTLNIKSIFDYKNKHHRIPIRILRNRYNIILSLKLRWHNNIYWTDLKISNKRLKSFKISILGTTSAEVAQNFV